MQSPLICFPITPNEMVEIHKSFSPFSLAVFHHPNREPLHLIQTTH
uniref:Uncharacterized protein n=1 Tax=Rhizophora mucronata TaxID=61149 RepID=A0A2P2NUX1_RHIMU